MTEQAFKELFYLKYNSFCSYANSVIKDEVGAEDIVQEIFIDFWKRHGDKEITFKIENYLIRAIKYKCIDYIRKQKVRRDYLDDSKYLNHLNNSADEQAGAEEEDLELIINLAIDQLPPKTREVFILSKVNKLTYKEISLRLKISEKTVENQMTRAFKHLRIKLKDYKYFLLLIIYFLMK